MVYSAAYFNSPEKDLNTAQIDKLDYICRKLRLKAERTFSISNADGEDW
jgi:cyclopropane-fatty-acyl-phospholipid synthase